MGLDLSFTWEEFVKAGQKCLDLFGDNEVANTFIYVIKEMLMAGKAKYNRLGEGWLLLPHNTKGFRLVAAHVCAAMLNNPEPLTDEQRQAITDWCQFWGIEEDAEVDAKKIRMTT